MVDDSLAKRRAAEDPEVRRLVQRLVEERVRQRIKTTHIRDSLTLRWQDQWPIVERGAMPPTVQLLCRVARLLGLRLTFVPLDLTDEELKDLLSKDWW